MKVVPAVPHGLVDVIIAGHSHQGIAHRIAGTPVIESYASGRAFGRVDLRIGADGAVAGVRIYPPHDLCPGTGPVPASACRPDGYEGRPVVASAEIARIIAPAFASAKQRREEPVGIVLATEIPRRFATESPLGNLFADLMLASRPEADVAITNGGGLRADLPAGPLEYGSLYAACPFDNRLALVTLTGKQLRSVIADNLRATNGIFSIAGMTATAACVDGKLDVQLRDRKGNPVADDRPLRLVTSDFLASGGDGALARLSLPPKATTMTDVLMRDAMAEILKSRGGTLSADELHDPTRPRLNYPGKRPVTCGSP